MKKNFTALAVLFFMCGLCTSSHAMLITIDFSGTIYSVGASISGDGVSVGDMVTGQICYDTTAPDTNPDANYGNYVAQSFSIMFGSGFSATSSGTTVTVQNDRQNGSATLPADGMIVRANTVSGGTLNGRSINAFQFGLRKENIAGDLWPDDFLPDAADWAGVSLADINAPSWHWMQFDMMSDSSGFDSQIRWDIASFESSAVPVPATLWLLGSGILGLVGVRKKSKK